MGYIYKNDLSSLVTRINTVRSKHGLSQIDSPIDDTAPKADNMNGIIDNMKGLTSSRFIDTVNASGVAVGDVLQETKMTEVQQELVRLENICVHNTSDYPSNNTSYDSGYYSSDYSSHDSYDHSNYNSAYHDSDRGWEHSSYNNADHSYYLASDKSTNHSTNNNAYNVTYYGSYYGGKYSSDYSSDHSGYNSSNYSSNYSTYCSYD